MKELCGTNFEWNFSMQEEMTRATILLHHEEYQLDNGPFKGYIRGVHTSHTQITSQTRTRGIVYKGIIPEHAYVFALVETNGKATHNGVRLYPDELITLNDKDKTDLTVSEGSKITGLLFEKDFFENEFEKHFGKAFEYDKVNKRIQLKKNSGMLLKDSVQELLISLKTKGEKLKNDPDFHDNIEHTALQILFENLDLGSKRKQVVQSDIDANNIREYIDHHYKEHIEVKPFYSSGEVAGRTIRSGFKRLFGFSVKQYLKQYRLGRAHYDLLMADPALNTVESISYDNGFSHMGRFNHHYQTMFGETPYCTLKKSLD